MRVLRFKAASEQDPITLPNEAWLCIEYQDSRGFWRSDVVSRAQARHILKRVGYTLVDGRKSS